ncbi:gas vesicle protein [Actinomadura formosensis]|uniref:gas vesicle protein n=1 Tax=Actinomadura formosensis TaxID=60706 RepID=UPI000A5F9C4A
MSEISWAGGRAPSRSMAGERQSANLAGLPERILDKGIVIVGDVQINLLTIKLRLRVASVDRAKEMGIDWWEHDPSLSSKARRDEAGEGHATRELREENRRLRERLAALESGASGAVEAGPADTGTVQGRTVDAEARGKESGS